jgi:N-acetylmuramic acid 6-phosphate etherase
MSGELSRLGTEQRLAASEQIDKLDTAALLEVFSGQDAVAVEAVRRARASIAAFVDLTVERMRGGGRLFYIGAGTSGRLGVLDAAECPPTFGVAPDLVQGVIAGGEAALARATEASEDDSGAGARDLQARGFEGGDTLVGIAASGRTPYVGGAIEYARALGALTAAMVCVSGSPLAALADIAIELETGAEVITGSTRLKAGSATKMALNQISTAIMIRLGHTFGNLMVNVQPRNEKLRDRARRVVAAAAGVEQEAADAAYAAAGGDVKRAVVMLAHGVSREQAQRLLEAHHGVLARALADRQ